QLAREQLDSRERSERMLQVAERAGVPGKLCHAIGQRMRGVGVPQLEGDLGAGGCAKKPEPTTDVVARDIDSQKQLDRTGERGRGRCKSLGTAQHPPVQEDVHGARWSTTRWH